MRFWRIVLVLCWWEGIAPALALDPYDPATPRFLISSFQNADQTKLYIATSYDGRTYAPLGGTHVYQTTDGTLIRDPSIIRYGGTWYVCHTSGPIGGLGRADYFRILSSSDLLNWTHAKDVSMAAVPNTRYTWAPEWFVDEDGSLHVVVSVSYWVTNEHVLYEIHPLDPNDLVGEWSAPARLFGPAFPEFIPTTVAPAQIIGAYDPYVIKKDGLYQMFYFGRTTAISLATSPTLLGPWTAIRTGNWLGIGSWKEGQSLSHLGGANWHLTYADAINSKLFFIESADDWQTWSAPILLGSPEGFVFNHGTVIYNPDAPAFQVEVATTETGDPMLTFPSLKENGYQMEWSHDLRKWHGIGAAFEGNGLPIEIRPAIGSETRNFYRVRWLPFW